MMDKQLETLSLHIENRTKKIAKLQIKIDRQNQIIENTTKAQEETRKEVIRLAQLNEAQREKFNKLTEASKVSPDPQPDESLNEPIDDASAKQAAEFEDYMKTIVDEIGAEHEHESGS